MKDSAGSSKIRHARIGRFQKILGFRGLVRFCKKVLVWTAGLTSRIVQDWHDDRHVFDSKAVSGRFAGDYQGTLVFALAFSEDQTSSARISFGTGVAHAGCH